MEHERMKKIQTPVPQESPIIKPAPDTLPASESGSEFSESRFHYDFSQVPVHEPAPVEPTQGDQLTIEGREFKIGDVHLNEKAALDAKEHQLLFPGPDSAHVCVTGDGRLGYELSHTDPDDPYRWGLLKDIIDDGHLDIFAVSSDKKFPVKEMTGRKETILDRTLSELAAGGASGITLVRRSLYKQIYPAETSFTASSNDDRDQVYYESGGNALAHELFGHLWLALQGVPFLHPESVEEAKARARARGETLSQEEKAEIAIIERRLGTLTGEHKIRDPFGEIYTGTVREYIDRYAGASSGQLESKTQRVSIEWIERTLESFRLALLEPGGLQLSEDQWQMSAKAKLQWEYLCNNYDLLHLSKNPMTKDIIERISTWYGTEFDDQQRVVFRNFVSRNQRLLARHLAFKLPSR